MHTRHLFFSILWSVLCASTASAQLSQIPNTGCSDNDPQGDQIFAVAGQQPTVGNLAFGLEYVCPPGSTAAFVVWGSCNTGPLLDWDLSSQCFSNWTNPPASCRRVYGGSFTLSGNLARQGKFVWPFPIPNIPELVVFTQTNPLCFQFICVDLDANPDVCLSVSAGLQMSVM